MKSQRHEGAGRYFHGNAGAQWDRPTDWPSPHGQQSSPGAKYHRTASLPLTLPDRHQPPQPPVEAERPGRARDSAGRAALPCKPSVSLAAIVGRVSYSSAGEEVLDVGDKLPDGAGARFGGADEAEGVVLWPECRKPANSQSGKRRNAVRRVDSSTSGSARLARRKGLLRAGAAMACGMALMLFSFAGPAVAQKKSKSGGGGGGGCGGNTAVTSYVSDFNGTAAYYVQSDGSAGPVNGTIGEYDDNQQGVCSYLWTSHTGGGWELILTGSTQRTFTITLGSNAVPGTSATPLGTLQAVAKMEDKCYLAGNNPVTMKAGDHFTCPFLINHMPTGTSGDTYGLSMVGPYGVETETGLVNFVCNKDDGTSCTDWTIDPVLVSSTDPNTITTSGTTIARLSETVNTHKSTTTNNDGDFNLTFHIHVTRP